ncbi:MAG: hypothetical protein JWR80_6007 [Bradyrhizobium sp.]|nr:hypothetical protein [Bradyrhizobium sp.]
MNDEYHFLELALENVRAFGERQIFDFRNHDQKAARWCIILGENGVGKTTALQALAMMRPVPAFERGLDGQVLPLTPEADELPDPDWIEPDVFDYQNAQLIGLVRQGAGKVTSLMTASLLSSAGDEIEIGFESVVIDSELESAIPKAQKKALSGKGPLIIGYGASRHMGMRNLSSMTKARPTEGLFDDLVELADPDEVLEFLDHAELSAERDDRPEDLARVTSLRKSIEQVISAVLPDLEEVEFRISGPRLPGSAAARTGISFKTPSAAVSLDKLSLGYRVTISWIVDLAWRLFQYRPESMAPFEEHAIVVIDEIDLHLHPRWQRQIRYRLLEHFPNVQFVATSHSPIIAQEAIANGDPVAVVRWTGSKATVINNPLPRRPWRYDEIVGSGAFGLENGTDLRSEKLIARRHHLLQQRDLNPDERAELDTLNRAVHGIEAGDAPYDAAFDTLMARVIELEKQLAEKK